jgi:hypothetical protein
MYDSQKNHPVNFSLGMHMREMRKHRQNSDLPKSVI